MLICHIFFYWQRLLYVYNFKITQLHYVWRVIMKKWFILITIPFILTMNTAYAEKLATVLKGQIVGNNLEEIQVLVTESDGSILDMTNLTPAGIYELDLTIMDMPSHSEVKKLILEVKNKSGKKKKFPVKQYINIFGDTVLLAPISFN